MMRTAATWRYTYLEQTHLLARYTDRTDRGMQLQWVHPEGPGVPLKTRLVSLQLGPGAWVQRVVRVQVIVANIYDCQFI